jgi:hypothetical protein
MVERSRVAKQVKRPNSHASKLQQAEADFQVVSQLVVLWEDQEEKARASLYNALQAAFRFAEGLRQTVEVLEDFVTGRGLPWNKITQENPYNALVKIAFGKAGVASQSQYSRVLRFAHDTKPHDQTLIEWLNGVTDKLDGRYREAVAYYSPVATQLKQSVRQDHLAQTKQDLASKALSEAVIPNLRERDSSGISVVAGS